MKDPTQTLPFRDFHPSDIPALVSLLNDTYPDEPTTVENETHWEQTYPPGNPRLRLVAEMSEGALAAFGVCMHPFWLAPSGAYEVFIVVARPRRRQGLGRALLARLEPYAREQGAARIHTDCREDFTDSIRFLERAGYTNIGIRFESRLDLTAFDDGRFAGVFDRLAAGGYEFTTLAAEREVEPEADRRLYDLYRRLVFEVPLPGGVHIDQTYENWRSGMLESPNSGPASIFIAKTAGHFVGMTSLELLQDGPAITSMTGVAPEHRGRGLALALKVLSFRFLKARGYAETRTHNDTANPPILRLNETLGYQRLPGWLVWEKRLGSGLTTAAPGQS